MFHFMPLCSTRLCPPPKEAAENAGTAHCLVEETVQFFKSFGGTKKKKKKSNQNVPAGVVFSGFIFLLASAACSLWLAELMSRRRVGLKAASTTGALSFL